VRGRGLREAHHDPVFGLYLGTWWLRRRRGGGITWPHTWISWPDFGLPLHPAAARAAIIDLHARAGRGERVEVACGGGTGRTGTVLACLATMDGLGPDEAVAWTRAHHRPRAVETPWQRRWVHAFARG
jgi:protein-tyrosine phosphatase